MTRAPSHRLWLEELEDRTVPATFGNAWIDPLHLTTSFAPDGTAVGSQSSQLFSLLGQSMTTAQWQTDLLKAIQAWVTPANMNVGLVADSGAAFGSAPLIQGNAGIGEIRFGAVALSTNEAAEAFPYQSLMGSWSGTILLNTNMHFGDGTNGTLDLYTVALHEVGHALSLDHNPDINSVMYESYQGVRTGLGASDVTSIQNLYGARPQDSTPNNSPSQATVLNLGSGGSAKAVSVQADISSASDVDFYRFTAPVSGLTTIDLKTAGMSLLTGQLTVYDASMNVIGSIANTDPRNASPETLQLNLIAGHQYTIEVQAAGSTFNVGAYQLEITPPGTVQQPPTTTAPQSANLLGSVVGGLLGNPYATATQLNSVNGLGYTATGTLVLGSADYYRITVSSAASQDGVISLGVTPFAGLGSILGVGSNPRVELYNAAGVLLPGKIVGNENSTYTIEVQGQWQAGQTLYVKVYGAGLVNLGGYGLSVNFQANPTALETMANTTLTAATPKASQQLTTVDTELYHFVLSATGKQASAGVTLTITNAQGQVVGTLSAGAGQTVSTNVWLAAGTYSFFYSAGTSDGSALLPLGVILEVVNLSDPIDPYTSDPTNSPSSPQSPPASQSSTSSTSTQQQPQPQTIPPNSSYTYTSPSPQPQPQPQSQSQPPGSSSPYSDPYWY
jgi:hypothetical protein